MGIVSKYWRSVKGSMKSGTLLHTLLLMDNEWDWTTESNAASGTLKQGVTSSLTQQPLCCYTGASTFRLGAIVAQVQEGK